MARTPTKICLQKTLKEGLRRCVYRRWQAEVKGNVLITKTTDLERMYRGNTPYPLGPPKVIRHSFPSVQAARRAHERGLAYRLNAGYRRN
jgi:hypothetical protein